MRHAVRAQLAHQLEVVGERVHRAHAYRGPGRGTGGVRLVFLPQGDKFHAEVFHRLDRHVIEDARALAIRTEGRVARSTELAVAVAADTWADAVLHAEGVAAAKDLALTVEGRQLPAVMFRAVDIGVLAFCRDDGGGQVQGTVGVDGNFAVDEVLAHGRTGAKDGARVRIAGIDVVILEEGIREFTRADRNAVQAGTGTIHVDVLQIQHVDVGTVVETLTDPGRAAAQEIESLCFDVGFDDAQLVVAEIGVRCVGIDPDGGQVVHAAGLGDGFGVAEFRVGVALIAQTVFHGVAAQAEAALRTAVAGGIAAGAGAQVAVEAFGVGWVHRIGNSGTAGDGQDDGSWQCLQHGLQHGAMQHGKSPQ
ncbi:hypothetical protein JaAD80_10105 [Janthinobacterium sp. AD80]|nr:hypothetical protein JaAD80_10105 [Janthinobacterium sp. AD80]